jgi:hypothetical protein
LPEFQEFLISNKLAPEKHVPFLAIWASKFLAFNNRKRQQNVTQTVAEFLKSLEAKQNIKDWQIRQAGDAVRLYLNHFKGPRVLSAAQGAISPKGGLAEKQTLLSEMKRLIRLKHFAYNTELAYLDWVERFFAYLGSTAKGGPTTDLTAEAVQNFLSHLAITKGVASSTRNQALSMC